LEWQCDAKPLSIAIRLWISVWRQWLVVAHGDWGRYVSRGSCCFDRGVATGCRLAHLSL
jgi:hypothetical protein